MKNTRLCLAEYVINCTKKRAARAALLFFLIQPIKSLICGVVLPSSFLKFPFFNENFYSECSSAKYSLFILDVIHYSALSPL